MKKNIEDIIKEQVTSFHSDEPSEGHFERFAQCLESGNPQKHKNKFLFWTLATAAVLFIFINILPFVRSEPISQPNQVDEVVAYYNSKIDEKLEAIQPLLKNVDDSTRNNLITTFQVMKKESEKITTIHPVAKQANYLAAIRTHYDSKLKSLQYIQSMLKNVRHPQQNG